MGILALILVLFAVIVVTSFSRQLTAEQDKLLGQRADGVSAFVRDHAPGGFEEGTKGRPPGGPREERPREPEPPGTPTQSGIAVFVVPPAGAHVNDSKVYGRGPDPNSKGDSSPSLGLPYMGVARKAEQERRTGVDTIDGPAGQVRVVSVPVTGKSGKVIAIVQAAQPYKVIQDTVRRLIIILVSVGLGALFLAGLGGLVVSRWAMRPVRDSFRRQRAFVADASHELKTPLALIKTGAEVIKRHPTDSENEEVVDDQLSEIDRMDALLSDLLLLARLDAGRLDVESKPFDLSVVAAEAADRFLARAAEEGVRLEVEVPERLPARGDPATTGQILGALLDNAIRHTPKGGSVTIGGRHLDDEAEASVADTGAGIPPGHLDRVFDRFYRAEEARSRAGGGTGLGLSIARDLARTQGGDLIAENAPGGGARGGGAVFRLSLPIR